MRVIWAALAAIVVSVGVLTGCNASPAADAAAGDAAAGGTSVSTSAVPIAAAGECGGRVTDLAGVEKLLSEPVGCPGGTNSFWHGELGDAWTPPRFVPYRDGQVPQDACGAQVNDPKQFADNALYCQLDDTVAYSVDFMTELFQAGGASYPLFVIMHELGHRGARIGGTIGVVSRAEENQADCFAGRQAKSAHDAKRIAFTDALQGALLFYSIGDTRDSGWFDQEAASAPGAHGTPRQRAQAFSFGYLRDSDTCHRLGQSESGSVPLF
ncbi:putative metalloprotease [Frankia casuarinae]|uniref:Metalloprotease n=1 Tax=Frankia casuarinae (strain DSM 45818 / CECT 9043 / HFP020203 / CcI3) TaxID=106370 RepID=Q2JAB6_FRACC|nr:MULTISPECIES: metalloprotease [Frankia]ABD11776.1 hypothetical protein Francci3_2409 [Frankia casuarinae]EYT93161.1 putative metalloprotease [Frankia casuarinae]OFB44295.1 metalloprotease [Frankia sp. CgIM4]